MSVGGTEESVEMTSLTAQKLKDAVGDLELDYDGEITSVCQAIDFIGFKKFQILLLYCGLAYAVDAMEVMIVSFLGPALACSFGLTPGQESLVASVVFIGLMFGAWFWGPVSDAFGRRWGFAVPGTTAFFLGVASAFAPSFTVLLIIRLIFGFVLSGIPTIFTLYMEFVPSKLRGIGTTLVHSFWTVGTIAETTLIWAVLPTLGWRWMLGLSALPLLIVMLLFFLVPESPVWLVSKGRYQDAEAVLQRVARVSGVRLPPLRLKPEGLKDQEQQQLLSDGEQDEEEQQLLGDDGQDEEQQQLLGAATAKQSNRKFGDILKDLGGDLSCMFRPPLLRVTLLSLVIWLCTALIYFGLVMLLTTIATTDGGSTELVCTEDGEPVIDRSAFIQVFVVATAEVPGLVLAAVVVDLLGRKLPLACGYAMVGLSCLLLLAPLGMVVETGMLWVARGLSMMAFTILWVYTPELFPTYVRSSSTGLCYGFSRIGGTFSPYIGVALAHRSLPLSEAIFGGLSLLAGVLTLLLPRDTKGAALDTVK